MPVVLPEKTLEHWASIYLASRYGGRGVQFWPVDGPDIFIGLNSIGYGKLLWLEMKTATWTGGSPVTGRQQVEIDLDQLDTHASRTIPTYYVLPAPPWAGTLSSQAPAIRRTGSSVLDLGFRRSRTYWFGNWSWVISAVDLKNALTLRRLATTAAMHKQPTGYLLPNPTGPWTISSGAGTVPGLIAWTDFWDAIDRCGAGRTELDAGLRPADGGLTASTAQDCANSSDDWQTPSPSSDPRAHIAAHHDATWTLTSVTGPVSTIAQRDATGVSHRSSSSLVLIPADALLPDPAPGPGEPSAR